MFAETFIKRPVLATVCSLVIVLAGALSIPSLPVAQFSRSGTTTGAGAGVLQRGQRGDRRDRGHDAARAGDRRHELRCMSSASSSDGAAAITITFDLSRNLDLAAVDVQNRISQVSGRLPAEVNQVGVSVNKVSANFVLAAGAYAEHGEYSISFIGRLRRSLREGRTPPRPRRRRHHRLRRAPLRHAPVARSRSPRRAQTYGRRRGGGASRQNVQVAAGQVGAPPSKPGQTFQITVRAGGRLTDAKQFDEIIVRSGAEGALVRLKDVGRTDFSARATRRRPATTAAMPSASASCSCRPRTRCRCSRASHQHSIGCRGAIRLG